MSWFSPVTSSSSTNGFSETSLPPTAGAGRGGGQSGPRRLGRRRRAASGAGALTGAGLAACVVVIASAPLLAGGVHRGPMIGLMAIGLVGLVAWTVGLSLQGRAPRMGIVALAPLAFVLVPLLQSVPIPFALRGGLDRAGTELLRDNQLVHTQVWPLSLDPPNTRADVGRAALALCAFLVAYHLASGQSRRHLVTRAIGIAGVVAVAIGLGHRILGFSQLYGLLTPSHRSLLIGPFVNSNHTAEFLELAAGVCLACSFQRPTALNRIGWLVGALLCAGGAAATLSRGSVLAIAMAVLMFAFLRYLSKDGAESSRQRRASLAWGALVVVLLVLGAAALGADQLVERFKTDAVSGDTRLRLWRDSLRVLAAHPFGIGRGAFDRIFPIYRTFKIPLAVRFAFVESEPLQLLVDCGWFFFLVLSAGAVFVVWRVARHGRRDRMESALLAGLFAVAVHSTVDFGLETLGVLLPFAAVCGATLGRLQSLDEGWLRRAKAKWAIVGFACAGMTFGIASVGHASYDDFDALLKRRMTPAARHALLARAEETHPLDYFYALEDARAEPLKGPPGSPSPRLHGLNRAMLLCPTCETVHVEVARNLWTMGLHPQALLEWRTAVDLQPRLFSSMLGELFASGAKPRELAAVASSSTARLLDLVSFLNERSRIADAFVVLDQADALGAPRSESLVVRAGLQLAVGQTAAAAMTVSAADAAGIRDPRLAVFRSRILIAQQGANGADAALAVLDAAAARTPANLAVQTERVELVTSFKKWAAAGRSIEGYKLALYENGNSPSWAHIADARIKAEMGRLTAALDEFRIALADQPENVSLWLEYGRIADAGGHVATAREAYAEAARLSPNSPDILNAQRALEQRRAELRALTIGGQAAQNP
jgi:tetratricopeptide (TPR) repeat protein